MASPTDRAFSTNYEEHMGLVHTFARKGWGRMIAAHVNVQYEDVYQEMSIAFLKATKAYDPEKGYSFTAYAGRAIWNEFNRYAKKHIAERMELGLTSMGDLNRNDGEDSSLSIDEFVASPERGPEDNLMRKQEILENLRALSPTAKFLVAQMISPSKELEEAFAAHQRAVRETEGRRAVLTMGLRFIGAHFGIERYRLSKAINELKDQYGV